MRHGRKEMPMPSPIGGIVARYSGGRCSRCGDAIVAGEVIRETTPAKNGNKAEFGHIRCPSRATNLPKPPMRQDTPSAPIAVKPADETLSEAALRIALRTFRDDITALMDEERRATSTKLNDVAREMMRLREEKSVTIKWQMPDGTTKPLPAGLYHKMFARLLKLCKRRMWPYLYGCPGGGKTEAGHQIAKALELDFGTVTLSQDTFLSRLVGFMSPDGKYVETDFYRIFVYGGIFLIDEMDNGNGNVSTALNSALANGRFSFPNGMKTMHKDCIIIATGNTTGYGGNQNHQDRSTMDAATRNRFFFLNWEYDWGLVRKITESIDSTERTRRWVNWIEKVSMYCTREYPELMVTPRAAIGGAKCLADGDSYDELLDGLVFQGYDKDSVNRILAQCGRPS